MPLQNDRQMTISAAGSRQAKHWPQQTIWWSELVERLAVPARGAETMEAYLRLSKGQQDALKDVGGFVGGSLRDGRRKASCVLSRDVVTLDLDSIPPSGRDDALRRLESLGCGYAVYSTRKHRPDAPRLRVLLPLSRPVTADEYQPMARKMAEFLGLEWCDPTTFEASRLMYWPSCCSDGEYVYHYGDKPFADPDGVLSLYADWRDVASWPQVPGHDDAGGGPSAPRRLAAKQGNPTDKSGIVGAFCRVYDVPAAMEAFLPGVYEPTDNGERFSFVGGSTTGGAVLYDGGAFLFSHHATDPCGGRLVNAFDLVRLHRFGDLDDEAKEGTPTNRMPSYQAMCDFAARDAAVRGLLNQERYAAAVSEFAGGAPADYDTDWMMHLQANSKGDPDTTVGNFKLILLNDPALRGRIRFDRFSLRIRKCGALPWDRAMDDREWANADDAGLVQYFEEVYGMYSMPKYELGLTAAAKEQEVHPVQAYLESLSWDGMPRLETLLIDFLGAEDTPYVRAVTRKAFVAAVARATQPGVKFDSMLTLVGAQGRGKTTFFHKLGGEWFSNSLLTFEGKEAMEGIQGKWIIEVGELQAMNRAELSAVKNYMSKTHDTFRAPYARRAETHPRQCVFFGTTNTRQCLRDPTGGRRFWPVDIDQQPPMKSVFTDLDGIVGQVWAEATALWAAGETLYLDEELSAVAAVVQEEHREENPLEGMILDFINRPIPREWRQRTLESRRMYWSGGFRSPGALEIVERDEVCALEIWCECLGKQRGDMRQRDTREINTVLENLPGWEKTSAIYRGPDYGKQRSFIKRLATQTAETSFQVLQGGATEFFECNPGVASENPTGS